MEVETEGTTSNFLIRLYLNLEHGNGVWVHLSHELLPQNAVQCLSITVPVRAE